MKTLKSLLTVSLLVAAMSATALALPPGKGAPSTALATQQDFEAFKSGDQLVLVCKTSDSIQIIEVKDAEHALQLCKDGEMVHCPECKKEYKVTRMGNPARKSGTHAKRDVVIVNADGEPCMFYAKLN